MNRLPLMHEDEREIPLDLQAYLVSPPRAITSFLLETTDKLILTNTWLNDKWSFVYFTHSHCLPECRPALDKMKDLQAAFTSNNVQFLVLGIDSEHESADDLAHFLSADEFGLTVATTTEDEIEQLAKSFIALFLKTDFANGRYQIEQEHHIFVVDPKGRVYATFKPPFSSIGIQSQFLKLRLFYAQTE